MKTKGFVNELKGKSADELQKDLVSAKLDNTAKINEVRKNIARIQTIITQKQRTAE